MNKQCRKCNEIKQLTEFNKEKTARDGLRPECKACAALYRNKRYELNKETVKKRASEWKKKYPERAYLMNRKSLIKTRYGITYEKYIEMLNDQEYKCKICGVHEPDKNKLNIDHCHKTGKVRGILCRKCNKGIGFFDDSADLLNRVIDYLSDSIIKR